MTLSELIKEILSEWGCRVDDGMPNPKNPKHLRELVEVLEVMGLSSIKNELIGNLLEADTFKNPALNKVISYKSVNGEDAEGKVGNLLRRPKEEDAYKQAAATLGGEDSDTYKKAMKDLGGEGQPQKDAEAEEDEGDGKSGEEKEQPKTGTALDPNTPAGKDFTDQLSPTDSAYTGPDKDKDSVEGDDEKEKSKNTTEQIQKNKQKNQKYLNNTKGITSTQNVNEIDGPNKENVLNGKEKVPGSPSSAVAEVGVGYGMACLSENEFDIKKADECLQNKLKETKLGEQFNTKELRKGALQGARRELIKVGKLIEEEGLNAETTTTGHVGGSKDSLSNTVKSLRDKGVTEVNGIPIDEYEKIILAGGGGDNPTDTMVVVVDQSSGKSFIYHTSNKMTSADQISNGSPSKEIDEIGSIASENYDETQKKELETAQQETKDSIQKHRNDQKEYIRKQQTKMADDANNPEIARRAIDRLKGVENPVSTSGDKYWKKLIGHKSVKDFAKEKGYDLKNLTPEQEVEVYQQYTNSMQNADPETERSAGGVGDDDIQIITRLYGVFGNPKKNQEEFTTGKPPKEPIFDEDELNSFYDKQTDELNSLREKMNAIKEGSGDVAFSKRMKKRLHLDIAEGKNPGGIPNDKFETVMGEYAYKDLKQDSDGNLYQQDKKTKKFYLVNSDGSLGKTPFDGKLQDLDVAVVADPDTIKKCLGLNEGDSIEDGIEIRVDLYDNRKVIIYDKDGKQVGFQSARSKTGPGGPMQDTIAYHPDFQKCLATQTVLMGK
jgi:hypothetical protein